MTKANFGLIEAERRGLKLWCTELKSFIWKKSIEDFIPYLKILQNFLNLAKKTN